MKVSRRVVLISLANLLIFPALGGAARGDALEDGAKELARKVAAALPAGQGIAIDFQSRGSSLTTGQQSRIRSALESELAGQGHPLIAVASAAQAIAVRVSEKMDCYLLIAEVPQTPRIVDMVCVPKSAVSIGTSSRSDIRIERELVLEQPQPILDFGYLHDPKIPGRLIVLGMDGPVDKDGRAVGEVVSLAKRTEHPTFPRDLRGWIELRGNQMDFALPGLVCGGGFGADSLWSCGLIEGTRDDRPGPESAKLGHFVPGRNYFQTQRVADLADAPALGLYFTAQSDFHGGWFATGVDGLARHFDEKGTVTGTFSNWGSEIAGIHSTCGTGRQLLVTSPGDLTAPDAIQVYEISAEQARPIGSAVPFAGPVTALWSSGDEAFARAVVRNLKTGRYEAYRLTIACGQ